MGGCADEGIMRCLYCGNELALLKKLTGYGEFCSEAHRQKYQEQYNRLALTRLLQAQDPEPLRRPLPLSRTPVRASNTLRAGQDRRQLAGVRPEVSGMGGGTVRVAPPAEEIPPHALFLPHRFEPASPSPRPFFPDPIDETLEVRLPDGCAVGPVWDFSVEHPAEPLPVETAPLAATEIEDTSNRGCALLTQNEPINLDIARVPGAPLETENEAPFQFSAEYEHTIGDFLSIAPVSLIESLESRLLESAKAPSGSEHNGSKRIDKDAKNATPAKLIEERADGVVEQQETTTTTSRSPVVINLAALSALGPGFFDEPEEEIAIPAPEPRIAPAPAFVAPVPQRIEFVAPALCSEPLVLNLSLANGAFRPIDDSQYEVPLFSVRTPNVATSPLRQKIVFGPNPVTEVANGNGTHLTEVPSASRQSEAPAPSTTPAPVVAPAPAKVEPAPTTPEAPVASDVLAPRSTTAVSRKLDSQVSAKPTTAPVTPPTERSKTEPKPNDLEALRLEMERNVGAVDSSKARSRRIAVLVALLLAILIVGYLLRQAFAASSSAQTRRIRIETEGSNLIPQKGGWSVDWAGSNSDGSSGGQIYIFRPSLDLADYRFEFQSKIEAKGVQWVFRTVNPRNYYAMKLELINTESGPKAVLSRAAVINGEETQNTRINLPISVRPAMTYKVRVDVLGSAFNTHIQDTLVDTWIDDRLKRGGVGLLKNPDEAAQVAGMQLHSLRVLD